MAKIIIVDYSLEIVIVIINYYYHNLHWMMLYHCLKQPHAVFLDEKQTEKLVLLSIVYISPKCERYIELVSSLNKKVKIRMLL